MKTQQNEETLDSIRAERDNLVVVKGDLMQEIIDLQKAADSLKQRIKVQDERLRSQRAELITLNNCWEVTDRLTKLAYRLFELYSEH